MNIENNEMRAGFRTIMNKKNDTGKMLFLVIDAASEAERFLLETKLFNNYSTPEELNGIANVERNGLNFCTTDSFDKVKDYYEKVEVKIEEEKAGINEGEF